MKRRTPDFSRNRRSNKTAIIFFVVPPITFRELAAKINIATSFQITTLYSKTTPTDKTNQLTEMHFAGDY